MKAMEKASLAVCAALALAAAPALSETRYGLFVGINEFTMADSLSACDWDAARMRDAWVTGGGCEAANATLTVNRQATKDSVRARFADLATSAKAGDTVLYFQSSHGGSNLDSEDEYTKSAFLCMTDDFYEDYEFADDLLKFGDGVNVVVIIDACNSGGMFKGVKSSSASAKGASWDFASRVREAMKKRTAMSKGVGDGPSVAFITAADWNETSAEISTSRTGEFTAALIDGWVDIPADANDDGNVTFAELADYAKENVAESSVQTSDDALLSTIIAGHGFDTESYRLICANGILAGFYGSCPSELIVPDGTTEICWSAFGAYCNDCENLTSVTIPASVVKIGDYAFYDCENLVTVTFEGDRDAIEVPTSAFHGTPAFASVFPPPANDNVADAIVVSGVEGTTAGSNYLATREGFEDDLGVLGDSTVWWKWTAPDTDSYEFNTFGSYFDTMIAVIERNDDGEWEYVVDNDDAKDNEYSESQVFFDATAGTTYYIGVSGYDDEVGDIKLNWKRSVFGLIIEDGNLLGFTGKCPSVLDLSKESITAISSWAFEDCSRLTSIFLPDSLESIGGGAFYYCTGLTSVTIPAGVTRIGDSAFAYCTSLETVTFKNENWEDEVDVDTYSAFYNTPWLLGPFEMSIDEDGVLQVSGWIPEVVTIPDGTVTIPDDAFRNAPNLRRVVIPDGVEMIGGYAFRECYNLESVNIPATVIEICDYAFAECTSLTNITFGTKDPQPEGWFEETLRIGECAFECTRIENLLLPPHVSEVGEGAFCECYRLTNVVFSIDTRVTEDYLYIEDYAFGYCYSLASATLRWAVDFDPYGVFDECHKLAAVNIAGGSRSECVSYDGVVYYRWFDEEEDDNGSIMEYEYTELRYIPPAYSGVLTLPESIADVEGSSFDDRPGITSIAGGNGYYKPIDGILFSFDYDIDEVYDDDDNLVGITTNAVYKYLVRCPEGMTGTVTLGIDVSGMDSGVFRNCRSLEKVRLPETMEGTFVFDHYFDGCDESIIEYYEVPHIVVTLDFRHDGAEASTKKIPVAEGAFVGSLPYPQRDGYYFLGWRTEPDGGMWVYSDTPAAEIVEWDVTTLYAQWQKIEYSYSYYSSGNGIVIYSVSPSPTGFFSIPDEIDGQKVIGIYGYAFQYSSITGVRIPETVEFINDHAFYYCQSLTTVELPETLSDMGTHNPFYGCPNAIFSYYEVQKATITLNANGGEFSDGNEISSHEIIRKVGNLPIPTRDDYDFMGWWTLPDGGEWISPEREVTDNFTAYAHWQERQLWYSTQPYYENGVQVGVSITTGEWSPAVCDAGGYRPAGTVEIPYGIDGQPVVAIGSCAFVDCNDVTEVVLPPTVREVGSCAFYSCDNLATVNIPDGVLRIYSDAFAYSGIESISIPASVTSFYSSAFRGCSKLAGILVNDNNPYLKSVDGVLYSKDGTTLYSWPGGKGAAAQIEPGTKTIYDYAFSYSGIESVSIPGSVESIYYSAFYSCTNLTAVAIPSSVTHIGDYAFAYSGLLPDGVAIGNPDAYISSTAFRNTAWEASQPFTLVIDDYGTVTGFTGGCPETIDIGELSGETTITAIGDYAFYGYNHDMTPLKHVIIPEGVTNIGYEAFYYCQNLESVSLPNTLVGIGNDAFCNCYSLTNIVIPEGGESIGNYAFCDCYSLTNIVIPAGVESIGNYAFSYCSQLREVVIPSSVTEIGNYAFAWCYRLEKAYLPASFEGNLYSSVFQDCNNVTIYYYNGDEPQFTTITLDWNDGSGYTENFEVFQTIDSLPTPRRQDYTCTGWWTTADGSGEQVSDGTPATEGMILYAHWTPTVYEYPYYWTGEYWNGEEYIQYVGLTYGEGWDEYTGWFPEPCISPKPYGIYEVPSEIDGLPVMEIGDYAFYGCDEMTEVFIPASVTFVSSSAFDGCASLATIHAPKTLMGRFSTEYGTIVYYDAGEGYEVTFDANGGEFSNGETTWTIFVPEGENIGSIQLPEDEDFAFTGWFTSASGGTAVGAGTIPDSDATFYAHWAPKVPFGTTDSYSPWYVDSDGSWRSGNLFQNSSSSLYGTVTGEGTLSFEWRMSSSRAADGYLTFWATDYGEYDRTDLAYAQISGITRWNTVTIDLEGDWEHSIRWEFYSDYYTQGACGWIRNFTWTPKSNDSPVTEYNSIEELPDEVVIASGVAVSVKVDAEPSAAVLAELAARVNATGGANGQDAKYFKGKGVYDAESGMVILKAVIDEEQVELSETIAEVVEQEKLEQFTEDGEMTLGNVVDGFYYGLVAAGSLEELDSNVDNVSWAKAEGGSVTLEAEKPTGSSAFFKVLIKD